MNSKNYREKYLKYKKKYIELKAQHELNMQEGGNVYAPGNYLFFIPEKKADFDSQVSKEFGQKKLVEEDGTVLSFNNLTDYLGNCTRFLRVGTTTTGFDTLNTYNTLYTNRGTKEIIKKDANDTWIATKPYIDKAVEKVQDVAKYTAEKAKEGYEVVKDKTKDLMKPKVTDSSDASIQFSSDDEQQQSKQEVPKQEELKQEMSEEQNILQTGGDNECKIESLKLDKNLLLKSENSINEDKLSKIIKFIESKNIQDSKPENKITRIIYVKKPIIPGKMTIIDKLREFDVNYVEDDVQISRRLQ